MPSITDKNLGYLEHLVSSIQFVCKNVANAELANVVFYNLAIAGEIVASKLNSDVKSVLPKGICENLIEIRNELLTHNGYTLAKNKEEIFSTLRSDVESKQLELLASIINKIIVREAICDIYDKFLELSRLDNKRFSKTNAIIKEIDRILAKITPALQALSPNDQQMYGRALDFISDYQQVICPIKGLIDNEKQKCIDKIDLARQDTAFKDAIGMLENTKKFIYTVEKLPDELPECLSIFKGRFHYIAGQTKIWQTTPQIVENRRLEIIELIKLYSTGLYVIKENLSGFSEQQLKGIPFNLAVQVTQYNAKKPF